MRTLIFDVKGQEIAKDPDCNFDGLVAGSQGYLKCKFIFGDDWKDYRRVVQFSSRDTDNYFELGSNNEIDVPNNIADKPYFKVSVHRISKDGSEHIETSKILIRQERGE